MKIAFTHNLKRSEREEEAEFDTPQTIAAITDALARLGHDVSPVDVSRPVQDLVRALEDLRPDLIFNTAEGTRGRTREAFYPALFEEMGIPYTGSDAYTCTLTLDKHLSKQIAASGGVPTPPWVFINDPDQPIPAHLPFPLIVKPNFEGSSKGITQKSVVNDAQSLREVLAETLASYPEGVLVESFIEGTDVAVALLEGASPATGGILPVAGYLYDWSLVGEPKHHIYDYKLKNHFGDAVSIQIPANLPEEVRSNIAEYARMTYKVLGLRDLGRIDFRVAPDGAVFLIDINALPSLEPGASIYDAAALVGLDSMEAVLNTVVCHALSRQAAPSEVKSPARDQGLRVGLIHNLQRIRPAVGGAQDEEAEFDSVATVTAIARAIATRGHEVIPIEASRDVLNRLSGANIDVAFNIAEGIRGRGREAMVPALLEHLEIPYTGSDPATLAITLDKRLAKEIVRGAGLHTPPHAVFLTGEEPLPASLTFPAIVKPLAEGSSKGVWAKSVVLDEASLREVARGVISRYRQAALVESYVSGREFTVAILGEPARALAPMEIIFMDKGDPHPTYNFALKAEVDEKVRLEVPARVPASLDEQLKQVAMTAFEALGCRDIARMDLRLDDQGHVHFLECNPLPGLSPGWSDLCIIAEAVGLDYESLIAEILAPALRRRARGEA